MHSFTSSLEDMSSILYQRRAFAYPLADICLMESEAWRKRLLEALSDSGKSKRAVSLAAGAGPGYMHSILVEGKDPTIEKLIAVCDALGVSAAYILHGVDLTKGEAELIELIKNNPDKRDAILSLLAG